MQLPFKHVWKCFLVFSLLFNFLSPVSFVNANSPTQSGEQDSVTELLKTYLKDYAVENHFSSLTLQDITFEGNRAYAVALVSNSVRVLSQAEQLYSREAVGEDGLGANTLGFVLIQATNGTWSITPAVQVQAAQEINLPVPFAPQVPPGDWNNTKNCGQTSSAMVFGFYGFYNHTPPNSSDITEIDSWLAQKTGDNRYLDGNGYYTEVTLLTDLAKEFAGYSKTYYRTGWTSNQIKQEIQAGHPVIVGVFTNMDTVNGVKHFMVVRGIRLDDSGNVTHVIVNDPGHSLASGKGENYVYSIAAFETAWAKNKKSGVVIIKDSSTPTPTCSAPSNGLPRDNNVQNSQNVNLSWTPPNCDGLDSYTIRISQYSDIENQPYIINQNVDRSASSITLTIPSQYNGQSLYWAIWPHNSAGNGARGGPWQFKIDTSAPPPPVTLPPGSWSVQYFGNKELNSQCSPITSFSDVFVFKDWGESAPVSGCPSDNWGARFTRTVDFQGGHYDFAIEADDWGRIYVDGVLFVDKWNGASQHYEGHDVSAGPHEVRVEFADTSGAAKISAWWWGPGFNISHESQDPNQWYANYWINPTQWWDSFAKQNEGSGILNHQWGSGGPGWDMPADNFSAKFQRTVFFECGTYHFVLDHDDGANFYLDNELKVDRWSGPIGYYSFDLPISRGSHLLEVDTYENGGDAHISFDWQQTSGCIPATPTLSQPYNSTSLVWNSNVTLYWDTSSGSTQYQAVLKGGPGTDISSGWISGTQWNIGSLWPGVYTWTVTARNDYGSSASSVTWSFTIQDQPAQPPMVDFDASPTSGQTPLIVTFHNLTAGSYNTCSWVYGDGQTGTSCAEYHTHTYTSTGNYTIRLSTTGPGGTDSLQKDEYIRVNQVQTCYSLSTAINPAGSGSISLSPQPNCNGNQYTAGTLVQVTANNNAGYIFNNWGGDLGGSNNPTSMTINSNKYVIANFNSVTADHWRGEYFANSTLAGSPALVRDDFTLYMDWAYDSPDPSIPVDNFSARWTRNIYFPEGNYRFHLRHDDEGRLYIDGSLKINAWDHCCTWDEADVMLSEGAHSLKVEMSESVGAANIEFWWERLDITSWRGEYFNNANLFERPTIVRNDSEINFTWYDDSPDPMIRNEGFSVRWTRSLYFPDGKTTFYFNHDDGARLYVDSYQILDNWCSDCWTTDQVDFELSAGYHTVMVEMYEDSGWSAASFWFESAQKCIYIPLVRR